MQQGISGRPLNITTATCTTPDVNVNMGSQGSVGFRGIDSRLAPVPFSIRLNNCSAGINGIKYRLDPVTAVLDQGNAVVALSGGVSSAQGVGVQILDNADKPLAFGSDITLTTSATAAGSSFAIPLKAAYYRTASQVTAGSANTALTFTMSYQ